IGRIADRAALVEVTHAPLDPEREPSVRYVIKSRAQIQPVGPVVVLVGYVGVESVLRRRAQPAAIALHGVEIGRAIQKIDLAAEPQRNVLNRVQGEIGAY